MARIGLATPTGQRALSRLGPHYWLRCLLYHDISEHASAFTEGLGVTTPPEVLAQQLTELADHYEFVDLQTVVSGEPLDSGKPPLLVTFDDAYRSTATTGAKICRELRIPSVFFVNGAFVDHKAVSLDNLAAFVANTRGLSDLEELAGREFESLASFIRSYLPDLALDERSGVIRRLMEHIDVDVRALAEGVSLYVTSEQLSGLPSRGMQLGNHTWSHVHCRQLSDSSFEDEVIRNDEFLRSRCDYTIPAFSYPYGSSEDATSEMSGWLNASGYEVAFLVEARTNPRDADMMRLSRVSAGLAEPTDVLAELEVLPRLRGLRDRLRGRGHE